MHQMFFKMLIVFIKMNYSQRRRNGRMLLIRDAGKALKARIVASLHAFNED